MDLIEREQAINAVNIGNLHRGIVDALQNIISELPSAEKTGNWIKLDGCNAVQCSECLYDFVYIDGLYYLCHDKELPNYCPNCGAKMEE